MMLKCIYIALEFFREIKNVKLGTGRQKVLTIVVFDQCKRFDIIFRIQVHSNFWLNCLPEIKIYQIQFWLNKRSFPEITESLLLLCFFSPLKMHLIDGTYSILRQSVALIVHSVSSKFVFFPWIIAGLTDVNLFCIINKN